MTVQLDHKFIKNMRKDCFNISLQLRMVNSELVNGMDSME